MLIHFVTLINKYRGSEPCPRVYCYRWDHKVYVCSVV